MNHKVISIFIFIVFLMGVIGLSLGAKLLNKYDNLEDRVTSTERSIITLQEFTIKHDEIIYYNMLSLYQLANSPHEDIEAIKEMIKSREQLWSINYKEK